MGAWGTGSFQNDDVLDWLDEFLGSPGLTMIRSTLEVSARLAPDEDLEKMECASAIGAAEVVAALNGSPNPNLPDDLAAWVDQTRSLVLVPQDTVNMATRVLERARTDSEMKDSWLTDELRTEWLAKVHDLELRLAGEPGYP